MIVAYIYPSVRLVTCLMILVAGAFADSLEQKYLPFDIADREANAFRTGDPEQCLAVARYHYEAYKKLRFDDSFSARQTGFWLLQTGARIKIDGHAAAFHLLYAPRSPSTAQMNCMDFLVFWGTDIAKNGRSDPTSKMRYINQGSLEIVRYLNENGFYRALSNRSYQNDYVAVRDAISELDRQARKDRPNFDDHTQISTNPIPDQETFIKSVNASRERANATPPPVFGPWVGTSIPHVLMRTFNERGAWIHIQFWNKDSVYHLVKLDSSNGGNTAQQYFNLDPGQTSEEASFYLGGNPASWDVTESKQ